MAQYVPYIQEVFPAPVTFSPDFNTIGRFMSLKQNMFERGISQASAVRNYIKDAPISNKNLLPLRNQFLQDADNKLREIAGADMSLPQNVEAARGIYSPFWENKFMIKNIQDTKSYQTQFAQLESWKNSSDPKVREQYSGITERYLMNGYEQMANANLTDEDFAKIERRKAIPFQNIERILEEAADKSPDKMKIVWDDPSGPYLVSKINGERTKKNFATWAESIIGNNFYEQFRVTGAVAAEEDMKTLKASNPNATDEQLRQIMADGMIKKLNDGFTKRRNSIQLEIDKIENTLATSLPDTFDESKKQIYDALNNQRLQLKQQLENVDLEYKYFDEPSKDRIRQQVLSNPTAYYSTLAKQTVIDNWSTGRASLASMKVDANDAWFKQQEVQINREKLNISKQQLALDIQYKNWEMAGGKKTAGTKTVTRTDANGNTVTEEVPIEGDDTDTKGIYVGRATTDITRNAIMAHERFMENQNKLFNSTISNIYDHNGILYFAGSLGLNTREISAVATAEKKLAVDPKATITKEENDARRKLRDKLIEQESVKALGIGRNELGPHNLRRALIAYTEQILSDKNTKIKEGADLVLNEDEQGALKSYIDAKYSLETYLANEANRNELIQTRIAADKKFQPILVDRDGKKDLIGVSDLKKDLNFGTIEAVDNEGNKIKLNSDDIAASYLTNKIGPIKLSRTEMSISGVSKGSTIYLGYTVNVNGIDYNIKQTVISSGIGNPIVQNSSKNFEKFDENMRLLASKYKSSENLSKLITEANEKIVPDLLHYKNMSGKIGAVYSYNFDDKKTNDAAARIFLEAMQPANMANTGIMFEDEEGKQVNIEPKYQAAIRQLLDKEENIEKYVSGFTYNTIGVNGRPTINFSLNPQATGDSAPEIGGVKLSGLTANRIRIELSPNSSGPMMSRLPNPSGQYIFGKVLKGESVEADPILKAAGFNFTINPDNIDDPSYVIVEGTIPVRKLKDPNTGAILNKVVEEPFRKVIYLKGETAKNPDEIMNEVHRLVFSQMALNNSALKQYSQLSKQQGGTSQKVYTKEDYLNEINIRLKK